jgi:hypothetical protein
MNDSAAGGAEGEAPRGRVPASPRANAVVLESCYQLLRWLIPTLDKMPRRQKFLLGDHLQRQAQDVMDLLIEAAYSRPREAQLRRANLGLEKLRFGLRLAKDPELLPFAPYEHAARLIDDLGR